MTGGGRREGQEGDGGHGRKGTAGKIEGDGGKDRGGRRAWQEGQRPLSVMPDGCYRASRVLSLPVEDGFPLKTCGNDKREESGRTGGGRREGQKGRGERRKGVREGRKRVREGQGWENPVGMPAWRLARRAASHAAASLSPRERGRGEGAVRGEGIPGVRGDPRLSPPAERPFRQSRQSPGPDISRLPPSKRPFRLKPQALIRRVPARGGLVPAFQGEVQPRR